MRCRGCHGPGTKLCAHCDGEGHRHFVNQGKIRGGVEGSFCGGEGKKACSACGGIRWPLGPEE